LRLDSKERTGMTNETHMSIDGSRSLPFVLFSDGTREGDPGGGSAGGGRKPKPSKKGSAKKTGATKASKKAVKRR
jgi:hypothetical protein